MSSTSVEYRPGDSPLHRLHPVTKTVLLGCVLGWAYLVPPPGVVLVLGVLTGTAATAGVARPVLRSALSVLVPLGVGLVVIHGLFTRGDGTALASLGPVTLWRAGAARAAAVFAVLAAFVIAGLTFVTTTHPRKLMAGLVEKGLPRRAGYAFVASLQLVPELRRRADRVLDAQRSRGLDTSGSLRARVRALMALLSPLLVGALISTQTRSLALDARGFSMPGPRTSLHALTESVLDRALRVGGVASVVALAGWRLL